MDPEDALAAVEPEETRCGSFALETSTASAEVRSGKTAER